MRFNFFGLSLMIAFCVSLQMFDVVQSSGTFELLVNNFQNPSEELADGSCCDQWCAGQCDNIFHFNFDQSSGSTTDPKTYYYFTKVTGTFQDQNNVVFNDNMQGVNNPILWSFSSWPGEFLLKIFVEDDDYPYTGNDYLDGMIKRVTVTPAKTKSMATATAITLVGIRNSDKTTMSVTYKLYCDADYYGSTCSVYCVAQDSDTYGHYTCDPNTGDKLCRTGWKGTDCKQLI